MKIVNTLLEELDSTLFDWSTWKAQNPDIFGIPWRFEIITSNYGKNILRKHAIGWCYSDKTICRPKINHIAIMFEKDDIKFWTHLTLEEFIEVFNEQGYL